jgi:hypothetical protein
MATNLKRPRLPFVLLAPLAALAIALPSARLSASDPGTNDWPMWGGTPDRNQVSNMKNVPS